LSSPAKQGFDCITNTL